MWMRHDIAVRIVALPFALASGAWSASAQTQTAMSPAPLAQQTPQPQPATMVLELRDIERGLALNRTSFQRTIYAQDVVDGAVGRIESEVVDVAANGDVTSITPSGIRLECRIGLFVSGKPMPNPERLRLVKDSLSKLNVGDTVVVTGKMLSSFANEAAVEGSQPPAASGRLGPATITLEPCEIAPKS